MELYDREEILCISVATDSLFMTRIGILTACIPPLSPESSIAINIVGMRRGGGDKLIQRAHLPRRENIIALNANIISHKEHRYFSIFAVEATRWPLSGFLKSTFFLISIVLFVPLD